MNKKQLIKLIENDMPDDAYVAFDMWYASDIMNNYECPKNVAKSFIDHLNEVVFTDDIDLQFDTWLWTFDEDDEDAQHIIKFRKDRLED